MSKILLVFVSDQAKTAISKYHLSLILRKRYVEVPGVLPVFWVRYRVTVTETVSGLVFPPTLGSLREYKWELIVIKTLTGPCSTSLPLIPSNPIKFLHNGAGYFYE